MGCRVNYPWQSASQKANITIDSFERTSFPNDFFDVVVGNVPFGNYGVADKAYDRHKFLIHDYFLAKSLDQVRTGGVVTVLTSSGTLDKKDTSTREYLAQRADLLGAIRLPNNAFRRNAGTDVVADILFLQKRDRAPLEMPEWVRLGQAEDGHPINQYFISHPEMVLMRFTSFPISMISFPVSLTLKSSLSSLVMMPVISMNGLAAS